MKKLKFVFATIVLLAFVSCIQVNFEEDQGDYGTVVFDLSGGSNLRVVGSDGLPNLAHSKMEIIVENGGNRADVKKFDERSIKQYKASFRVGSKIKVTAIVMTQGGKWKGMLEHTVTKGINSLNLKLKKATFALEPLKFNLSGNNEFRIGFFKRSIFFKEGVARTYTSMNFVPSFCRDQLGRTYLLYNDNSPTGNVQFRRYKSDGVPDSFISPALGSQDTKFCVASDHKTGNVFVSYFPGGGMQHAIFLLKEKKAGQQAELLDISPSDAIYNLQSMAIYDDKMIIIEGGNDIKVHLYNVNGKAPITKITEKDITDLLKINIKGSLLPSPRANVTDSYMNDNAIYILYNCYTNYSPYIAVGGILKIGYGEQKKVINLFEPMKIVGRKDEYIAKNDIVNVQDETRELYGPQHFVGFDEKVLYIADDGVIREEKGGLIEVLKNKNRLVRFNINDEKILVLEGEADIESWMPEG